MSSCQTSPGGSASVVDVPERVAKFVLDVPGPYKKGGERFKRRVCCMRHEMSRTASDLKTIVKEIAGEMAERTDRGEVANYIPELANVHNKRFGLVVIDGAGNVAAAGDSAMPFSIQSISKVFTLTLALGLIGEKLWHRVGREPSGSPFNSIVQLEYERGTPRNPFINAGALAVTDLILSAHHPREALGEIL